MIMYKSIRQVVTFQATSHEVYELLMDRDKHAGFTGAPAEISREVGGEFSAYDGFIAGMNLELAPDQRIVQTWRGNSWPEGYYSTVVFELEQLDNGTGLRFTQTGVPEQHFDEINQGWISAYWEKMAAALAKEITTGHK
jgi:activator of HSP90 ATPase